MKNTNFGRKALKVISGVIAAVTAACAIFTVSACGGEPKPPAKTLLPKLTVDGTKVVDPDGEEVFLRGINAGGLFVTEHWMTGFKYGSTPSNDYRSLTQTFIERFGEEQTKELWAEYRADWWSDTDFEICENMGINVIRLPFSYMNVDFAAVTDYSEAGKNYDFSDIDDFVERAARHGIYTILDLHGAYGSQNGQDHSGQIIENKDDVGFYSDEEMTGLTVKLWGELAKHYKDNTSVAAYDILNEPGEKAGTTTKRHWDFYDRVYDAIRAEDGGHIVIFESCWDGANLPQPSEYGWENCMYSFHHYAGDKLAGSDYMKSWSNKISEITSRNFGVPLQMGEFTNYTSLSNWNYVLSLMNGRDWHWVSWTYKVWGKMPWGVINVMGSNAQKVDAGKDSYDEIIQKFRLLKTEQAEKYAFSDGTLLESVFAKYCKPQEKRDV